ncbi:MAG: glycoside hydrolase, partial [Bacteroidales bacterium]|nr:glycoside hydrolase [Bacteroidales bacterium]
HRKDLRLYMSFDQGETWTEAFQLQPGYAAYSSMQKLDNGDLAIIYEDGSIGNKDLHDCYAINYVVISSETLEAKIDELYAETFATVVKNAVYQTGTGCDTYGSFTDTGSGHWARTWTSNAKSGLAGLIVSTESGYGFDKATILDTRVMTIKPSADGASDTYTITAPDGYFIDSYTIGGAAYTSGTYRFTAADGTTTTGDITSTSTPTNMTVSNVNAQSTTFTFYGASQTNWLGITTFTITLKPTVKLNAVGEASYATLYLPFDVTLADGTKAYYVGQVTDGSAKLTELTEGIPAKTAVVLINSSAATSTTYTQTTGLTSVVSEDANLLKGTLSSMTLDLSESTPYYSLGKLSDEIGFYKFQNGETTTITLGANKAYLEYSAGGDVKGFALDLSGITDAIRNIEKSTETGEIFDISGRRVTNPTRGLYIVNGKKVMIK